MNTELNTIIEQITSNQINNIKKNYVSKKLIETITKQVVSILKEDSENAQHQQSQNPSNDKARSLMLRLLDDPMTTEAEVMRQLWNPSPEEEDEMRSLFTKKKNGHDANGKSYSFTDQEVQRIIDITSKRGTQQ